jgi:hypothetical protein
MREGARPAFAIGPCSLPFCFCFFPWAVAEGSSALLCVLGPCSFFGPAFFLLRPCFCPWALIVCLVPLSTAFLLGPRLVCLGPACPGAF